MENSDIIINTLDQQSNIMKSLNQRISSKKDGREGEPSNKFDIIFKWLKIKK